MTRTKDDGVSYSDLGARIKELNAELKVRQRHPECLAHC